MWQTVNHSLAWYCSKAHRVVAFVESFLSYDFCWTHVSEEGIELLCSKKSFAAPCCFKHPQHGKFFCLLPNISGFNSRVKLGSVSYKKKKGLDLKFPIVIIGILLNISDRFFICKWQTVTLLIRGAVLITTKLHGTFDIVETWLQSALWSANALIVQNDLLTSPLWKMP